MEFSQETSDHQIITLYKDTGNPRAFSALVTRYEQWIYKKCYSYVHDEDTAEDLCQEVLIKLYLQVKNFRNQAKFSTWLFSIIHNICIDYLRKNKRNVRSVLTRKLSDQIVDLVEDEEDLPQELSIKILEDLLEQISPDDKMLLIMKYLEKHQIKDIQLILGLSESAIKMRLKRAREKINELYQKHSN